MINQLMMLKQRLPALLGFLPVTLACNAISGAGEKPNFIIILADDLGYNDLGCYGTKTPGISTPNIDLLALEGIRFTDWQSAHSISGPSRASILTGRYPSRCGYPVSSNEKAPMHYEHLGLPQDEVTIAGMLRPGGYYTAAIGKWHLGENPAFRPLRHGFDEYFGCMHNFPVGGIAQDIYEGDSIIGKETYENIHRQLTDRAIEVMGKAKEKGKPFFIYLAHYLTHGPWEPGRYFTTPEEWDARMYYKGKMNKYVFPAMVRELDYNVGRLMEALRQMGLDKNTVIFFLSDNGPWLTKNEALSAGCAWPLRGSKFNTFEGGHRVPAIVSWPAVIKGGTVCSDPVSSLDILPAIAALSGTALPDRIIDGIDISPLFYAYEVKGIKERELLYYHATNLQAVRLGEWKLHLPRLPYMVHFMGRRNVGRGTIDSLDVPMLFRLSDDPGEKQNVADLYPDIVTRLKARADERKKELGDWDTIGYAEHKLTVAKDSIIKRPLIK